MVEVVDNVMTLSFSQLRTDAHFYLKVTFATMVIMEKFFRDIRHEQRHVCFSFHTVLFFQVLLVGRYIHYS